MSRLESLSRQTAMFDQLCWFVRLRWGAGAIVMFAGLADWRWLGWFGSPLSIVWVGAGILGYNVFLRMVIRPSPAHPWRRATLVTFAWGQIIADLVCLTLLILLTGGVRSPLMGFAVFHMVIVSLLLLRRRMAYAGALVAMGVLTAGLHLGGQYPTDRPDVLLLAGWFVTLVMTVYLTSSITRHLHQHRRRMHRQSSRIRSMSKKLRRQQDVLLQQDKMAAMGQMAAGVAHEIANPLACMDSVLQLVQRNPGRLNDETITTLRDQISRINSTVRQLTDFAHPIDEKWQDKSIDEIVAGALQMVRFDHRLREVKLDVQRQGDGRVRARPHALEQVLVNIFLNALDAMAERGRSCRACHSTHASPNAMHVRKSIAYGRWQMPINYSPTRTGGTCASGCHRELSYDRVNPVKIDPKDKPTDPKAPKDPKTPPTVTSTPDDSARVVASSAPAEDASGHPAEKKAEK